MAAEICWTYLRGNLLCSSLKMLSSRAISGNPIVFRCVSSFIPGQSISSDEKTDSIVQDGVPETTQVTDYKNTEVHPDVIEILEKSRPKLVGNNWHKPKLSARRVAELRKKFIAQGYFWPRKPLVDRELDKTPKGHRYERVKEEKLAKIEENMKNMPKIIEEYRKKMKEQRAERKEEKKTSSIKSLEAKRLGIHPKDPRWLAGHDQKNKSKMRNKKKGKA